MEHDTAGDPVSGIKWTRRTTEKIAAELATLGIDVCANTVAKLLKDLEYRLRVNHKKLSGGSAVTRAERDTQFAYIAAQRDTFTRHGWPIVSIDSKKRELVGNFKNNGATWSREPTLVNDHDFRSDAKGIALPYGIYDITANHGHLFVGTSHDTPTFAVDNIAKWWTYHGRRRYPDASELLVLADGGGSNGDRNRAWKHALQHRLCRPPRPHRHRLPLPQRRLEMESYRASAVQRTQQELGRPTPRQLRDHPQLRPHHHHQNRPEDQRPPGLHRLPHRRQDQRRSHGRTAIPPPRHPAPTQLHDHPQE